MKILLINKFIYPRGGAELSTLATGRLLREKGHTVFFWGMDHPENPPMESRELLVSHVDYHAQSSLMARVRAARNLLYSMEARRKLNRFLDIVRPDIVHLNNFAHQLSPSILHSIAKHRIPAVMTMRDFKMVCPAYLMVVDGEPCERCANRKFYHCTIHRCVLNSRIKSLLNTVEMVLHHSIMKIYRHIHTFISPSRFLAEKVREMGFPYRVEHLSNFSELGDRDPHYNFTENTQAYAGRLSVEKGLMTLLTAMKDLPVNLKIFGEGPLKPQIEARLVRESLDNVKLLGYRKGEDLYREIESAMAVVLASECYENNPRSIIDALALGKPALGARIGGIPELIRDGSTGYTFQAGNPEDLADKVRKLMQGRDRIPEMGRAAREFFLERFTPDRHYERLMEIYQTAIQASGG